MSSHKKLSWCQFECRIFVIIISSWFKLLLFIISSWFKLLLYINFTQTTLMLTLPEYCFDLLVERLKLICNIEVVLIILVQWLLVISFLVFLVNESSWYAFGLCWLVVNMLFFMLMIKKLNISLDLGKSIVNILST